MQTDLDYMASILNVFEEEAETAHISLHKLQENGVNVYNEEGIINEKFLFHIGIMIDETLVSNDSFESYVLESLGISKTSFGGKYIYGAQNPELPIRLTSKGHDFAKALRRSEVLAKLKKELKDAPFKTIFEGSQKLLNHYSMYRTKLSGSAEILPG